METAYSYVLGDIGFIILDTPPKNVLTEITFRRISLMLDEFEFRRAVKAVVFTGAGENFSGGANLKWMQGLQKSPEIAGKTVDFCYKVALRIIRFPKPTIAAIKNGICFGAGFELAMCCQFIVAKKENVSTIKFGALAVSYGFMLGLGVSWQLAHKISIYRAACFLVKKDVTSLSEAYNISIVDFLLPGDNFQSEVVRFARLVARKVISQKTWPCLVSKLARLSSKEIDHLSFGCPIQTVERTLKALELCIREETDENAMKVEKPIFKELFFSDNAKEAIDAFLHDRKPEFFGEIVGN